MNRIRLLRRFVRWLALYHPSIKFRDIEATDVPGYFRIRRPCAGAHECRNPLHACLGNEGPVHHTIRYSDDYREHGRFVSQHRTWRLCRESFAARSPL